MSFDDSSTVSILNSLIVGNENTHMNSSGHEISNSGSPSLIINFHNNLIGFSGINSDEAVRDISVTTENGNIFATSDGNIPRPRQKIILPLADNGGAIMTYALPPGSPAINKATDGFYTGTFPLFFWNSGCRDASFIFGPPGDYRPDQRGVNRPIGAACDVGAYEAVEGDFCYVLKTFNNKMVNFCL